MSEVTMYAAVKIVNEWLKEDGVEKILPPQMMYMYAKKGYIKSFENEKGKVCATEEALRTWYDSYRTKKTATEIVADNDGTVGEWA
jgi:hypothetical protein